MRVSCSSCVSVDELMRARVMSQFPLHSSLLCTICPRVAFHPHYLSADGTFLPPPSLVLTFSALFSPFTSHVLLPCLSVTLPAAARLHFSCVLHLPCANVAIFFVIFVIPLAICLHYSEDMSVIRELLSLLQCKSRKGSNGNIFVKSQCF